MRVSSLCRATFGFLAAFALGCGSDKTTAPVTTGTLAVTVSSAPLAPASVRLAGPGGFAQTLIATTIIPHAPPGSYTVKADSTESPDSIVGETVFTGTVVGSPAVVTAGDTAKVSVTYALDYERGALWASDVSNSVNEYGGAQLTVPGTIRRLATTPVGVSNGLVFDANGDMWVSRLYSDTLYAYTIAARNSPSPISISRTIDSPSLGIPEQMAFDSHGTLWVADFQKGLVGFSAAQVASGGHNVTAAYSVVDSTMYEQGMQGITFDSAGNAWVSEAGADQLVAFSAAQLEQARPTTPVMRINSQFADPSALTFDTHGNLWVANELHYEVDMFTPGQLAAGGFPLPTIAINTVRPAGLAWDESGNLWVGDKEEGQLHEYTPAQLTASGNVTPARVITVAEVQVGPIAFDTWAIVHPDTAAPTMKRINARVSAPRARRSAP